MKFVVSSSILLKQLSAINGVVSTNPIVPILENFLLALEGNLLTVTASDLQTVMITEIEVESSEKGAIAIPAKLLLDTLRGLPEQPITLQVNKETFGIEIISDNGRYKLSGENPVDFPKTPAVNRGQSVSLSSSALTSVISNTLFATSTDDLRPAMTGVFIQLGTENATFVATDGHRLVRYRRTDIQSGDVETSMIIQRKALNLLKSCLPSEDVPVKAEFTSANAFFNFGNIRMICRLIDERFPDYENAIPANNPNSLTINRLDILSSLRRISIYSNRTTHQVRLKLTLNNLVVSAEDLDYSNEANERLMCEYNGDEMEIGFNAKFLIEVLGNLTSKIITFQLSAPNRAGLIIPVEQDENEDILMLVMPVMLNNYA
jgi:DNA polymerase-3 subunit beta